MGGALPSLQPMRTTLQTVRERRPTPLARWISLVWLLLLANVVSGESPVEVINPKERGNQWVSDMAAVVDDATEQRLNALINELERETTAEIAVVTIHRTDGRTPKEFATDLFNQWGIGKKAKDNGMLILLVVDTRRIEIETGYGLEGVLPDSRVGAILDTQVIPHFKRGDFGGGLLAGVEAMARVISRAASEETALPETPVTSMPSIALLVGLGLLALVGIGYAVRRSRIRYCPQCHKQMRQLTEDQDDAYLSVAQRLEEELGSRDYHVWRCDDCQTCRIERASRWTRAYEECPKCGHATLQRRTYLLREPTYERDGTEVIERLCRLSSCNYRDTVQHRIPRLPRPPPYIGGYYGGRIPGGGGLGGWTSDGGGFRTDGRGSFGGGSSGGGGAGRSW